MDFEKLIYENIDNPPELEKLYRKNPEEFTSCFERVFAANPESVVLKVWNERLHFTRPEEEYKDSDKWGDIFLVIILSLFAGTVARLPVFIKSIDSELFYLRYPAFIFFIPLAIYFIIKNRPSKRIILSITILFLITLVYIRILPLPEEGYGAFYKDSVFLSFLHLPFFLWALVGLSFTGDDFLNMSKRMDYLRFNGGVLIYAAILLIVGMILTTLTFALFDLIKINIGGFFEEYVIYYAPFTLIIVATYLVDVGDGTVRNLASSISRVFSPLVLIILTVYLLMSVVTGENPYTDRDFLLLFNMILLIVLAITIFTVLERAHINSKLLSDYINSSLIFVALIIDLIALSAILFRLTSYGLTPNRIAVLGANILIFINLAGVITNYIHFFDEKSDASSIKMWIAQYLPVYVIWTAIVTFGFPIIFFFK